MPEKRPNILIVQAAQDYVFVTKMSSGRGSGLRPLPTQVRDDIRAVCIAREGITLAHRVDGLRPDAWRNLLGMVVDRPKIQGRTITCKITGIGGWMAALIATGYRQAQRIRIEGIGGMDVEITEQDLLGLLALQWGRGGQLACMTRLHDLMGHSCTGGRRRGIEAPQPTRAKNID